MPDQPTAEPPPPVLVGRQHDPGAATVGAPGLGLILFAILSGLFGLALGASLASPPAGVTQPRWLGPASLILAVLFWAPPVLIWLSLVLRHAALLRRADAAGIAPPPYASRMLFGFRLLFGGMFVVGGTLFTLAAVASCLLRD